MSNIDTAADLDTHYGNMASCIRDTIAEVIPPKKKLKYNGRTVSAKTKHLYDQRVQDFATGREITKDDRRVWNKVLAQTGKDDWKAWVEQWVKDTAVSKLQTNEATRVKYIGESELCQANPKGLKRNIRRKKRMETLFNLLQNLVNCDSNS